MERTSMRRAAAVLIRGRELIAGVLRRLRHRFATVLHWLVERLLLPLRTRAGDAGMTTAEYAVGTIAACGFAAILYQVITGDSIISALGGLITRALSTI